MLGRPALLTPLLLAACTPHLRVSPRYGEVTLDGDISISAPGVSAANDFSDLGLDQEEQELHGMVDFKWGLPHLTIGTVASSFSGDGTLEADITFGGQTITAGTDVRSNLDFGVDTAVITFDLAPTDMVELGLGLGVSLVDFDARFRDLTTNEVVSTDEQVPIPVLAGRATVWIGDFEASVLLSAIEADVEGDKATYYDLDAYLRYHLFGFAKHGGASIMVGYREAALDVEYDDGDDRVELDLSFSGPYAGIQISF